MDDKRAAKEIALLGLNAIAGYMESGLVKPGEEMHKAIAVRLARIAAGDKKKGVITYEQARRKA
jgi:hypothetical protein